MEFFKQQFARIQQQLSGLSASQKMLAGCLVVIMAMTLMWWSYWAAEPEMEPVLNQSMSQDDITQIVATLDGKDIPHKVVGDKVLVPADRKLEVLAELGYAQALPRDFKTGFDDIISKMSWIDSPDKTDHMYLEAKERTLSMVIGSFPGVSTALVVIDPTNERRFDDTQVQPSAMVTISTNRNGRGNNKQLAESAADVVSGAEAGLARSRINIVIDGASYKIPDSGDDSLTGDSGLVDALRTNEDFFCSQIRNQFGDINGLMVSVSVDLDTKYTETREHKVDPKSTVSVPTQEEDQNQETTASSSSPPEAGAVANVSESVSPSAGGGNSSTSSDTKTTYAADNSKTDSFTKQGPGSATVVAASVRVPRSYFVASYKIGHAGSDPDDAALAAYEDSELTHMRQEIKACTGLTSDDAVVVAAYNDATPTPAPAQVAAAGGQVSFMLGGHVKEIGVGALALVSMFMVSSMVKKGAPAPVVAVASNEPAPTQRLATGEHLAGEVGEGGAMLDGIELDEDSVKTQQMVEQVQELVQANPDGAANLVKRWLNHP
jgi:flagellar biosynthesis/type III secretory pathway M-ring protein FliF/YscJ